MKAPSKIAFLIAFCLIFYGSSYAKDVPVTVYSKDLGACGATYPIAERDAYDEVMERAKEVNWNEYFNREKIEGLVREYRPSDGKVLSRAKKDIVFQVDPTYTLPFDIPDAEGRALYPSGYTFNPLDYVKIPTVVVIDGSDLEQLRWFKNSKYFSEPNVMLLITGGSYWFLSRELGRPVFYANREVVDRFGLRHVPSVVLQKKNVLEIREVDIEIANK